MSYLLLNINSLPTTVVAFWRTQGYMVSPRNSIQSGNHSVLWDAYKDNIREYAIALAIYNIETNEINFEYYWDGKTYSEAEIIKVYKMKIFA